jgi:hypothetical protein
MANAAASHTPYQLPTSSSSSSSAAAAAAAVAPMSMVAFSAQHFPMWGRQQIAPETAAAAAAASSYGALMQSQQFVMPLPPSFVAPLPPLPPLPSPPVQSPPTPSSSSSSTARVTYNLSYELRKFRPECTQICHYISTNPHAMPTPEQICPSKIRLIWEYLRAIMCDYARTALQSSHQQQQQQQTTSSRFPTNRFPSRSLLYEQSFEIERRLARAVYTRTCPCKLHDDEVEVLHDGTLNFINSIDLVVAWMMEQHLMFCSGGKSGKRAAKLDAASAAAASSPPIYNKPEPYNEVNLERNLWLWAAWRK